MAHSISSTFGKLLNTVGTVADAATKIVDNTASTLDMADLYIRTAKEKQEARVAADMDTFYEDLQNEVALENAVKQTELNTVLNSNSELKKIFETKHANLNATIDKIRTKYRPE